ncbi:MAG: DUF4230 domain-containing protein [Bacteroidetes bacterium]|nr:MAG: DUF4230 domain-containing protein [Bacteroidota bacterium]
MKKISFPLRGLLVLILLIACFGLGVWVTHRYYQKTEMKAEEKAQVLLDRIKTVAKLITVEGYFSEIYQYDDYWGYDLSWFKKKALLRVKARVSVGYDLSQLKIESFPEKKQIIISNIPDPEILSIDHDIDYYDIQEGIFNSFTNKDYTRLQANVKNFIREKAKESDLFIAAEKQSNQMLEMIRFIVESAGWQLVFKNRYGQISAPDTLAN